MDHLAKRFYTREEVVRLSTAMPIRIGNFSIFSLFLNAKNMYNANIWVIRHMSASLVYNLFNHFASLYHSSPE